MDSELPKPSNPPSPPCQGGIPVDRDLSGGKPLSGDFENFAQVGVIGKCLFIVDVRINETFQTGAVRNRTYRIGVNAVRLETAPTGPDKSGSKPRDESVYLFLEFTINAQS